MALDLEIGTATIFMEASGQSPDGQAAIAHVLLNRMDDGRWGHSVAAVCLYPSQFSCWNTVDPNRERLAKASDGDLSSIRRILDDAMDGLSEDPTNGALYYFNPSVCRPSWAALFIKTGSIGSHDFYKEPPKPVAI